MNIRNKLLFQFSIIVVTIVLSFTVAIFYFSANYRKTDYLSRLEDRANNTSRLLLNVDEVDEALLKIIDKNTMVLFNEQIYIFNQDDELIYQNPPDAPLFTNTDLINLIKTKKHHSFSENKRDVLGILYESSDRNYVVIISAYDKYGLAKIRNLKIILAVGLIISVIATFILGLFFASKALAPISDVINQVNSITVSNLSQRVDEGNQKDEIALLSLTFNKLLQRIEDAFILQSDFVSNAAHELRTPFTVLLTEIDFTLMQERNNEYYKNVLLSLSGEIKKLSKLSNGLLDLARISFDKSTFHRKAIRIDELLIEVCNTVLLSNNKFDVKINFGSLPENDDQLSCLGSEQLLTIAFKNMIDNACKFSESKSVEVKLESNKDYITISFSDQGIGILHDDIDNIFQPFYRGKNTQFIAGYGIGLALTQKIIHLHNGKIKVTSEPDKGSTFTVLIPNQHSL
jgi:signal transduction histidine kinase